MSESTTLISGLILTLFIASCSTTKPLKIIEPDPASVRIAQVAESIQKHNNDLNDIEMARFIETYGSDSLVEMDTSMIPSINKVVSLGVAWHGPIDKLINKLSVLSNLNKPRYLGVKPSGDVIVNINTDYRPIIEMLHDAGTQAGSRADVRLKVKERLLEVEYFPY